MDYGLWTHRGVGSWKVFLSIAVSCAVLLSFGQTSRAEELPLPIGVSKLHKPRELVMGSQPVKMTGYSTDWSLEQLRKFYEQELPKRGWRIEPLPWLEQVRQQREKLDKAIKEHQTEIESNPDLKKQVETVRGSSPKLEEMMRRQMYAAKGKDRVLLNFTSANNKQKTVVYINQWEGPVFAGGLQAENAAFMGMGSAQALSPLPTLGSSGDAAGSSPGAPGSGPAGGQWPQANPCCGGQRVPQALRKMPSSVPTYPNGRIVATGAAPSSNSSSAVNEMFMTEDSVEQVSEFYRSQMVYNGWSADETSEKSLIQARQMLGPQADRLNMKLLTFKSGDAQCGIAIVENIGNPSNMPGLQSIVEGKGTAGGKGNTASGGERTVVMVNYLETQALKRPDYVVPADLLHKFDKKKR